MNIMYESKINELVNEFWEHMESMFDQTYNLIAECHENGKTDLSPLVVDLAKNVIIGCGYDLRDDQKKEELPKNKHQWKLLFIEKFMIKTNKYWQNISDREDYFFIERAGSMFSNFDSQQVQSFSILFGKDNNGVENVNRADKDEMWGIFIDMIACGIEITHYRREPYMKEDVKSYKTKYMPMLKLSKYAKKWKVDLTYKLE